MFAFFKILALIPFIHLYFLPVITHYTWCFNILKWHKREWDTMLNKSQSVQGYQVQWKLTGWRLIRFCETIRPSIVIKADSVFDNLARRHRVGDRHCANHPYKFLISFSIASWVTVTKYKKVPRSITWLKEDVDSSRSAIQCRWVCPIYSAQAIKPMSDCGNFDDNSPKLAH